MFCSATGMLSRNKVVTLYKVRRDNNYYEGPCGVIGDLQSKIVATFLDESQANDYANEKDCNQVYSYVVEKHSYTGGGLTPIT